MHVCIFPNSNLNASLTYFATDAVHLDTDESQRAIGLRRGQEAHDLAGRRRSRAAGRMRSL